MIRGVHTMYYSSDPDGTRAFLRDVIGFPATDVGEGWLIFELPQADMGVHPAHPGERSAANTHDVSFYCDDIHGTVAGLKAKGVEFTEDVHDEGFGLVTHFRIPGGLHVQLYEPQYHTPQRAAWT
jgi:catechol 2,3-dioxygenase-like lactoylglutathione lyase family enzyme